MKGYVHNNDDINGHHSNNLDDADNNNENGKLSTEISSGNGLGEDFQTQEWSFETMLQEMYELQLLRKRQRIKAENSFRTYKKKNKYKDEKRTQASYYDHMMKSYELQTYTVDSETEQMMIANTQPRKQIFQKNPNVLLVWDWENRHCVQRFDQIRKMIISTMKELGIVRIDLTEHWKHKDRMASDVNKILKNQLEKKRRCW